MEYMSGDSGTGDSGTEVNPKVWTVKQLKL